MTKVVKAMIVMNKIEYDWSSILGIKVAAMDRDIKTKRDKKSDKGKEKYERNGGFSQKHVRIAEALAEKRVNSGKKK